MKLIEIAVSCLNDDILKIPHNFKDIFTSDKISIHVIHQTNNDKNYSEIINILKQYPNLRYSHLDQLGLPVSRNFALQNCKSKYLIPTDSDVVLFTSILSEIDNLFRELKQADYLTLQSYFDSTKKRPRRTFNNSKFRHTRRTLLSVSSIELILKVDSFKSKNVFWDYDFGLGARFGGGLETVMLQDAYQADLIGYYIPLPICYHEEISSGSEISLKKVYIRSAVFERSFGKVNGKLLATLFHIKNYKKYKHLSSFEVFKAILVDKKI